MLVVLSSDKALVYLGAYLWWCQGCQWKLSAPCGGIFCHEAAKSCERLTINQIIF